MRQAAPDLSVIVTFHKEGAFAIPALRSLQDLIYVAKQDGRSIESIGLLDTPDNDTVSVVNHLGKFLDRIEVLSVGDPSRARNFGMEMARGHFLAFLDGDDLWGKEWLSRAHRAAAAHAGGTKAVWHPEWLYFFSELDFDRHSRSVYPAPNLASWFLRHCSSVDADFDVRLLALMNLWSANVFADAELYRRYPYQPFDRENGLGIEDWSWNMQTVMNGVSHLLVPDTVHLIRKKLSGSFGTVSYLEGLLPWPTVAKQWDCRQLTVDATPDERD